MAFNFNFSPPRAGFTPPVAVEGVCADGHPVATVATLAELDAGLLAFCPVCAAWVLPRWDLGRWGRSQPDQAVADMVSQEFSDNNQRFPADDIGFTPDPAEPASPEEK